MFGDRFYVVEDGATIYIYDTDDFRLLKTFGQRGDGPGQFRLRPDHTVSLYFQEDRILVNSDGKISYFTLDGDFLVERPTPQPTIRYRPLGNDRLVYRGHAEQGDSLYFTYMLCDTSLTPIKEIARVPNDYQPDRTITAFAVSWEFYTIGNLIYIHDRQQGQVIDVYDQNGRYIRSHEDDYQPIHVTQTHIDGVHEQYRTNPYSRDEYEPWIKDGLRFPEYFSAIRAWTIADDKIYIFSFSMKEEKNEMRIYGTDGHRIDHFFVPLNQKGPSIDRVAPYTIGGGWLYQFVQDDSGKWRLRVTYIK